MNLEWEQVGNHDLRINAKPKGGFFHVALRDADDGDVVMVNEDDVRALRDRLTKVLEDMAKEAAMVLRGGRLMSVDDPELGERFLKEQQP